MKQIIVINISNRDLPIPELKQVLPAGTIDQKYVLPYDIAVKYKQFLYPIQVIDPEAEIKNVNNIETIEDNTLKYKAPKTLDELMKEINTQLTENKAPKVRNKTVRPTIKPLKGIKINPKKCNVKEKKTVER